MFCITNLDTTGGEDAYFLFRLDNNLSYYFVLEE